MSLAKRILRSAEALNRSVSPVEVQTEARVCMHETRWSDLRVDAFPEVNVHRAYHAGLAHEMTLFHFIYFHVKKRVQLFAAADKGGAPFLSSLETS